MAHRLGVLPGVVGLPRPSGPSLLEAACPPQLPGAVDDELHPVGALVVYAAAANGLGEVPDGGPRHAWQVAQVAGLSPRGGDARGRHAFENATKK